MDDGRRSGGRPRVSGPQVGAALREAQQLQQEGNLEEAVLVCEDLLDAGVDRSDVHYFLGWLYQESDRWDEAAAQFELLLDDPDYALSCFYALGQCFRAMGNLEEAARYFDAAVDRVNLDALTLEEVDQLLQLCQEAAEAHREMNDLEGASTVFSALLGFLRSQGWREQVAEVERMMHEVLGTTPQPQRRRRPTAGSGTPGKIPQRGTAGARRGIPDSPLDDFPMPDGMSAGPARSSGADFASSQAGGMNGGMGVGMGTLMGGNANVYSGTPASNGDHLAQLINSLGMAGSGRASLMSLPEPLRSQVSQAVRSIENYVAHGLLTAAVEECMTVMELAPQYLDVHLLLGEIYVRQGKSEQAVAKYAVLVETYLAHGRIDDAIATFRRILQLEPSNLTYRVKLIELLTRQGRSDEALVERIAAADAYLRMGYADRAIGEYEQALMAQPNNGQLRLSYGQALMKAGRVAQAVGEIQRVLQVDPTNVRALATWQMALATGSVASPAISSPGMNSSRVSAMEVLGRLLAALRAEHFASYTDIARDYLQASDLSPTNPDLRYALGQVHLVTGRHQEALVCFQQIAAAPGMEVLAHFGAGQALMMVGDPQNAAAAVRELEEASALTRRMPPDPAVWMARPRLEGEEKLNPEMEVALLLARAYQLSGQSPQGNAILQTVQSQRAVNDEVYQALGQIAARQGDPQAQMQEYAKLARHYHGNRQFENAIAVLREMANLNPDDPAVHSEMAEIQIARGMLDEGLSEYRQLGDIHVRHGHLREAASVYQKMSEVAWGVGNQADGLMHLRQAIQYATDDMQLRQQYVQYCLEMKNVADAIEQQVVVARYYFASRQTKEAVAALQQLIAMDKSNFEAYDLLGQTYYSVGEYEQAARVYRNLAKVDPSNQMARARLQELQAVRSQMG
ncbi:MAG TPA: tetratricopeptide repeat protein [Ktedonobacterales bacterium]|jgi:tetratricopeptide (TPR) repeat protein